MTKRSKLRAALAAPFRPLGSIGWSDLWILAGFSSVAYGLWQLHESAAWIACGGLVLVYGLKLGGLSGSNRRTPGARD